MRYKIQPAPDDPRGSDFSFVRIVDYRNPERAEALNLTLSVGLAKARFREESQL
jgi:hypothetical protein